MSDFARILIRKRKELGLSQDEMANKLNVTRQAISKWENGKGMPDMSSLPEIAEILGVSVDELLTGKEPETKIEIVEKVVVREKEVVKPMPAKKILAIVVPILAAIVLATSLMGVYIPAAIAKKTPPAVIIPNPPEPPVVDPEPVEPEYLDLFVVSSAEDASDVNDLKHFKMDIDDQKIARYVFKPYFNSDYTFEITAPKGAKVLLNGEEVATFEGDKTKEYSAYLEKDVKYKLEIDVSQSDIGTKKDVTKIRVRQKLGYEGITVRANSEYAFVITRGEVSEVKRLFIDSPEIRFTSVRKMMREPGGQEKIGVTENGDPIYKYYQVSVATSRGSEINMPLFDLGEGVYNIDVFILNISKYFTSNGDYIILVKNTTGKDANLKIHEKEVESVELNQLVKYEAQDALPHYYKINAVFKPFDGFDLRKPRCYFTDKNNYNNRPGQEQVIRFLYSIIEFRGHPIEGFPTTGLGIVQEGWRNATLYQGSGEFYMRVYPFEGKNFEFVVTDYELQQMPEIVNYLTHKINIDEALKKRRYQ